MTNLFASLAVILALLYAYERFFGGNSKRLRKVQKELEKTRAMKAQAEHKLEQLFEEADAKAKTTKAAMGGKSAKDYISSKYKRRK